jgi:cell division protein FtsB
LKLKEENTKLKKEIKELKKKWFVKSVKKIH